MALLATGRWAAGEHEITWRENVPVVSWLLLKGRCRWCGWPIPWRYPLVELLTAFLWGLTAWLAGEGEWALTVVRNVVLAGLIWMVSSRFFFVGVLIGLWGAVTLLILPTILFLLFERNETTIHNFLELDFTAHKRLLRQIEQEFDTDALLRIEKIHTFGSYE